MLKVLAGFFDIIEFFVSTAAVAILIYLFLTQPHEVNGNSMFPNFHDKEFLLTDKLSYRLRAPARGDVVIFSAPPSAHCPVGLNCDFIKRIVGLPGEKIMVKNGRVYINDQLLREPYLTDSIITHPGPSSASFLIEGVDRLIPEDSYITLGDNRGASSDSRDWGVVTRDRIVGKAWIRYWPPKVAGILSFALATTQ